MNRRKRTRQREANRLSAQAGPGDAELEPARSAVPAQTRYTQIRSEFSGPLPPPEALERYGQIVPNGADRIVSMAESQIAHRQVLESAVVLGNVRAQNHGQVMAFILGLVTILGGIGLIAFDKDAQGLAAIIIAFVGLGGLFIYGRFEQKRERQKKRDELRQSAENPQLPFDSN